MQTKYLSVIVPVLNEQWNIKPLYNEIRNIVLSDNIDCEIIFINDFSNDETSQKILEIIKKDTNTRYIENKKNLGIYDSWKKGLEQANGEIVCLMMRPPN